LVKKSLGYEQFKIDEIFACDAREVFAIIDKNGDGSIDQAEAISFFVDGLGMDSDSALITF